MKAIATVAVFAAALTLSPAAAQAAPSCPSGYLCVYDGLNLTGRHLVLRSCGFHIPDTVRRGQIRSYDNQAPGTAATFWKQTGFGWVPVVVSIARDIQNSASEAVRTSDAISLC